MDNCWLLLVFLGIFLFLQMVTTEPKDNQVYIISRLCNTTVSIDSTWESDRWRRLLFAEHEMCQGSYTCQVTFRANVYQTEVCIDFARLQLFGNNTSMIFTRDNSVLQRLTSQQYPKVKRFMESKICASPGSDLALKIQADCSKPMDRAIIGWFYAYAKSSSKDELYFVDGACKHRHRLAEGAQVTVRSQLWEDIGWEVPQQYSSLRLSLPQDSDYQAICVSWSGGSRVVRSGMQVNARMVYYNIDNTFKSYLSSFKANALKKLYLSVKAGDWIPYFLRCYGLEKNQELLIEVFRDTQVPHLLTVMDGDTLFSLKAEIGPEHATVMIVWPDADEENQDTEFRNGPSSFIFLKIIMGGAAVALVCCCACCYPSKSKRNTSESRDTEGTTNQPQTEMGERADSYVSINSLNFPMVRPEAHPMLPVPTPTAPGWEQNGENDGGTLSRGGASDLPPSYEDVSGGVGAVSDIPPAPPAYSDLFPVQRT